MEPLTVAMGALLTDPQAATCDDGAPILTRQVCSAQASKSAAAGDLEAAIAWCSRALELLEAKATAPGADSGAARANADTALRLRRAEYAMQAVRFSDAVRDADDVLGGGVVEKKAFARAVRLKCRALLALDRVDDALREWETRLSMGSRVLDELAFRREFGVAGKTPEYDDPRYDVVLQHFYRHDYGNTISLLNKAMDGAKKGKGKSKSKDPVLFLLRARCRIELKEYEGAVSDAERVLTLLPTAVEAYRWLCEALIAVNKPSQASRMCQLGLSIAPSDEALLVLNERLQTSKQEFQQRQTKKKKKEKPVGVVESEPPRLTGSRGDGEDECEPEEEEEAQEDPAFEQIRVLKRAVKTDPRNAELFARLSEVRFGLGQYEQAEKDAAHAIALDGTAVDGYVRSCEALYAARRYAKALRVCEQGLRMAESTSGGTEGLQAWESKLQDALVEPPPEEPAEYSGPVGKTRVPKAVAARKQQRAQRLVDDAHLQRTKCLEKAAELADDRDFGNAVYWLNKAEAYQSESGAARIFALRARCRFELKQYDHVAKDAERAVALDLTDAESYRWWGLSLKARGHTAKAREVCATGLAAAPDHKPLLALMRSLDAATRPSSK